LHSKLFANRYLQDVLGMTHQNRTGINRSAFIGFAFTAGIGTLLACSACGYKVRGSVGSLPAEAQSLGIPTFRNLTTQYKVEQLISSAVLKEFSTRTRTVVNSSGSGVDVVLLGEIHHISSVPVTFDSQSTGSSTFGSAFLVTMQLSVKLVRRRDSGIIWQNNNFLFRERYMLNGTVRDFFSEENPALERLARDFATSLASSILNRSTP
jgi:hypothetical protein